MKNSQEAFNRGKNGQNGEDLLKTSAKCFA